MNLELDHFFILEEPLCIYVPFAEPVTRTVAMGKFSVIRHVRIQTPVKLLSEVLQVVAEADLLSIEIGDEHLAEVTFDDN